SFSSRFSPSLSGGAVNGLLSCAVGFTTAPGLLCRGLVPDLAAVVTGSFDHEEGCPAVQQARQQPGINFVNSLRGGDHGRQLHLVAVVDDLVQLLACPARVIVIPQVIQNQQ